jgi:hypothetical protein
MRALAFARALVFVLLLGFTLWAMPWSYLPLLFANVDTQAILTRSELRRVMGPIITSALVAVAWIGVDAWLSLRLSRRPEPGAAPAARPEPGKPAA